MERGFCMKKYICTICQYIYDPYACENEGVSFWDLPDDYECPTCGAGKEVFEEMED
jgi:rubredoxin